MKSKRMVLAVMIFLHGALYALPSSLRFDYRTLSKESSCCGCCSIRSCVLTSLAVGLWGGGFFMVINGLDDGTHVDAGQMLGGLASILSGMGCYVCSEGVSSTDSDSSDADEQV